MLLTRLLREALLRAGHAVADHTRNALILSVFAFKVRKLQTLHPIHTLTSTLELILTRVVAHARNALILPVFAFKLRCGSLPPCMVCKTGHLSVATRVHTLRTLLRDVRAFSPAQQGRPWKLTWMCSQAHSRT